MIQKYEPHMHNNFDNEMYDAIIVGSGISGATIANLLHAKGKKVLVLEKREEIGGNCYTAQLYGIDVHVYGAHIFRTSKDYIWNFVNKFVKFEPFNHKVVVNYNGSLYSFPINLMTLYQISNGEIKTPEQAQAYFDLVINKELINSPDLQNHCKGLIGEELFNIFIKGYTEKQWGKPCSELPSSIIKRIPVRTTFNDNYFADSKIYQGIPVKGGYTEMFNQMLKDIPVYTSIDFNDDYEFWEARAKKIIYTGPIDELRFGNMNKLGKLAWRSLEFKSQILPHIDDYQGVPVMNFTSKDVPYTRIIEHKHFCPSNKVDGTIITFEYPKECKTPTDEKYYPMSDSESISLMQQYKSELLKYPQYVTAGRLANYQYYDMDMAMDHAMKIAIDILSELDNNQ